VTADELRRSEARRDDHDRQQGCRRRGVQVQLENCVTVFGSRGLSRVRVTVRPWQKLE
jgi:hypothetical protein